MGNVGTRFKEGRRMWNKKGDTCSSAVMILLFVFKRSIMRPSVS